MNGQWTIKKILIRILAYIFSVVLFYFGYKMLIEPINLKSRGAGIGAISIAVCYIFIDIKLIIEDFKLRKNK